MVCGTIGGCRKFIIDDEGEIRIASSAQLTAWVWEMGAAETDSFEAALDRGFIHVWLCDSEALVLLRPDRVSPLTMAGAMDKIARLNQDWTMVWPMAPGGRMEAYRGCTSAIRRIGALVEEAGREKPCAGRSRLGAMHLEVDQDLIGSPAGSPRCQI